jgi:hypothetical protein
MFRYVHESPSIPIHPRVEYRFLIIFQALLHRFYRRMSYVTESTIWPSQPMPPEYKSLLEKLYLLSDTKDESIGRRLASEVFTPHGEIYIGSRKIAGSDGS